MNLPWDFKQMMRAIFTMQNLRDTQKPLLFLTTVPCCVFPPDGKKTDIVATGFRAANGVCINPDGTWIVTDQEGHWNPKNRINYAKEGGFYGNMMGYHDIEDSSDNAMEQPLAWITNAFDRSPAELLWVPENGNWGELNGKLLTSVMGMEWFISFLTRYWMGRLRADFCSFPIDRLPTGIHRGRFHPKSKDLFAAGMFAWAGSQREDGGFIESVKWSNLHTCQRSWRSETKASNTVQ